MSHSKESHHDHGCQHDHGHGDHHHGDHHHHGDCQHGDHHGDHHHHHGEHHHGAHHGEGGGYGQGGEWDAEMSCCEHKNPILWSHLNTFTQGKAGIKVFVPLCGTDVNMKYLAEAGHSVVGIELSETAIKKYFETFSIKYKTETVPGFKGKVFVSEDAKLKIYQGDFYDLNKSLEGNFNAVWDAGAMCAVSDTKKYVSSINELMAPGCVYFLCHCDTLGDEPGHGEYTVESVKGNFPHFKVELISTREEFAKLGDALYKKFWKDQWEMDFYEELYCITKAK